MKLGPFVVSLGALLIAPLHACNEPTYVTVKLTTDVPCDRIKGVAITVGTLGPLETKVATTRTDACNGAEIGTLTVVPSGDESSEFGVRVVMGIDRDVDSCTPPDYGDGCVVARRGLRFLPDESLTLPITLRQICNGIPCGPRETCVKGACRSAIIADPSSCKTPDGCSEDTLATVALGGLTDLRQWCGSVTDVDYYAVPYAMPGGCPARPNRGQALGPGDTPPKSVVLSNWRWLSLSVAGQRGIGAAAPDVGGGVFHFGVIDLASGDQTFDLTASSSSVEPGACVVQRGTPNALCFGRFELSEVDTQNGSIRRTHAVPPRDTADGGVTLTSLRDSWNVGKGGRKYVTQETNGTLDVVAEDASYEVLWRYPLRAGAKGPLPFVLSGDEQLLYVGNDVQLVAIDTATGKARFTKDTNVKAIAHSVKSVVTVEQQRATYHVRLYDSAGNGDFDAQLEQAKPAEEWSVALGLFPNDGVLAEQIYVLRDGLLEAVDRTHARWRVVVPPAPRMVVDAAELIYVAGQGEVMAVSGVDGSKKWSSKVDGTVSGIALGNGELFVVGTPLVKLSR